MSITVSEPASAVTIDGITEFLAGTMVFVKLWAIKVAEGLEPIKVSEVDDSEAARDCVSQFFPTNGTSEAVVKSGISVAD